MKTGRQTLRELLETGDHAFESLRSQLGTTVRTLEADLRHVEHTARAAGKKLVVTPATCEACDYVFRDRGSRHFHTPGRCPKCGNSNSTGVSPSSSVATP